MSPSFPEPRRNRLLAGLPGNELKALSGQLEPVEISPRQVVIDAGDAIPFVYFPLTGAFSLVQVLAEDDTVEVAMVGREGMVGVPVFLGAETFPARVVCQVPSQSLRLPASVLPSVAERSTRLHEMLARYTNALLFQIARGSACNRMHTLHQRAARWILTTRDHAGDDGFPLTHESLAQMLGVRRAGVSEAAGRLRQTGLITYSPGRLRIIDRAGLELASCECYRLIADEVDGILSGRR